MEEAAEIQVAEVQPAVDIRALGVIDSDAEGAWRGVGAGVRVGGQAVGPLWVEGGVDLLARPPHDLELRVAPALRVYAARPEAGLAALSLAGGAGLDLRLPAGQAAEPLPLLFGELSVDMHVGPPWSVRVSAGYAATLQGPGMASLGLGLLWVRPRPELVEPAPAPVAEPERWVPYPVCAWTSEQVAHRTLRDLEERRPPLPGERSATVPEAPASGAPERRQGEVVVIALPGDFVYALGAAQEVDREGVSRFQVRVDDEMQVEVVGGGRAQPIALVAQPGRVTWLRAEAPEVRRLIFPLGEAELDEQARQQLAEWAGATGHWGWELHGSYSPEGQVEQNRVLGQARAEAVRQELIRLQVPADRVRVGVIDEPDPALSPELQRAVRLVPVREGG